ncbi:MAG: MinD/ParA family protein [Negativicutes bacterium]|nr:MinD/ParA family protein [Negativicutes bacterium]
MNDQANRLRQMNEMMGASRSAILKPIQTQARVITVTSGKGGVGKTNVTVALAVAFARLGKKVLILDADLGLSNVDVILGASAPGNLFQVIHNGLDLNDVVADGPLGIKFISGGSGIYDLSNLSDSQIQYFLHQVGQFDNWADIILIDTGAGLNRMVLNFVLAADEVIVVTTPEPTAVADAYAVIKAYAAKGGQSPVRLIVNRVRELAEGEGVLNKLAKVSQRFLGLSISHLGFIFEDRMVQKSVTSQVPLMVAYPDSVAARCIDRIAHSLLFGEDLPVPRGIRGLFQRLLARG